MSISACIPTDVKSGDTQQQQHDCVLPESLEILNDDLRYVFIVIYVVASMASLVGNIAVIYSVNKRKYRYIQKTCIISLALSDILSTLIIAINNLETFSHRLIIWTLGEFLCSFIPMCQMTGILASSIALMFIAMDRYRNVVHALSKRWNPSRSRCLICAIILWLICFGVSYPMFHFFEHPDITLIYIKDNGRSFEEVDAYMCLAFKKASLRSYYIVMVLIIFLPLLIVFVWFYYNIASLIWKHRKPTSAVVPNSSTETGTVSLKDLSNSRNIRVERKIRTFRIIVTLTIVFIICRLPYVTIFTLKLSLTSEEYGLWTWILNYIFTVLQIVNCCLNPLLYTFLKQTLTNWYKIKKAVKAFTWEICCFCFSNAEFEEFEKENPFVDSYQQRCHQNSAKFEENVQEIQARY